MVIRWCVPPVPQYHMVVKSCIPLVSTVGSRLCIPSVNTIQHGGQIVHSTSQHSTTWWTDNAFHQSTQYHMVDRQCIPPVNTVPHGGQTMHSTSQHSTTWWSGSAFHRYHSTTWYSYGSFHQSTHLVVRSAFHQSTQLVVRWCIPPVNTVPHGGRIVHSTNQHSTTWWSDGAFHQSTHLVVTWCIPPVYTVPHGGQMLHSTSTTVSHGGQSVHSNSQHSWWQIVHSISQHNTTWWSDDAFHQSTQYHMVVRWCIPPVPQYHMVFGWCIPPVNTLGGQICIPPVNPVGGQMVHSTSQHSTTWWTDGAFHQSSQYHMVFRSCIPPVTTVPHGGQIVHSTSQSTQ